MPEVRLRAHDLLLVLSIVLSPIDTFSLGVVGPGEILIAVWLTIAMIAKEVRVERHYLSTFWYLLLLLFIIGTIIGQRVTPNETTLAGLSTWVVLAIVSIGTLSAAMNRSAEQLLLILVRAGTITTLFYFALFVLWESGVSKVGPLPLDFAGVRFTGGASNPHLLAVILGFALFAHLNAMLKSRRPSVWLFRALLIGMTIVVGSGTGSSTFILTCLLTPTTWLIIRVVRTRSTNADKAITFAFVCLVATTMVAIFRNPLLRTADEFISSDENGYGRIDIWRSFDHVLDLSPIFGLGPGTHGMYGLSEFHNSFLDIGAIGGVAALSLFLIFVVRTIWSTSAVGNVVLMVLPYVYYGVAGFSARRLSFWIVIPLVLGYVKVMERDRSSSTSARSVGSNSDRLKDTSYKPYYF